MRTATLKPATLTGSPAPVKLPSSRRAEVLDALYHDAGARVSDLAARLGVSAITIRRDLAELERAGLVQRVHGGALLPQAPREVEATVAGRIGMLVPGLDFYWPEVARGVEQAARERGLRLLLRGDLYESPDERPALAPLFELEDVLGVLAVINTSGPHCREVVDWLAAQPVPSVLIERETQAGPYQLPVESVVTDHAEGARLAVRHLWSLGHRRIGLVVSRLSPTTHKVTLGWQSACAELGVPAAEVTNELICDYRLPTFGGEAEAVIQRCLATDTTALLVHSDREALGLVQHLEAHDLAVPRDLSIVAYDDELAGLFSPALTAIRPARGYLGRAAVGLLLDRRADRRRPAHRIVINPELFVRESTAPPRAG